MTQQYYFSFEQLDTLLKTFNPAVPGPAGATLEGFVFTPGTDEEGNEKIFAFPLFLQDQKLNGTGGDLLLQNTTPTGCPFPPKC